METVRRIQRKLGRAVTWEPTHDVFFRFADMLRTSQSVPPLYVAQSVLLEVDARLREADVPVPFGLLVGDWCVCPRTAREYLLVAEIMPGHIEPFGEAMTAALVHELRTLARIAE